MKLWKRLALETYYPLTSGVRGWRNKQLAEAGRAPVMSVIFHRVAADWANGWTTHVDTFVKDIDWLQRNYELVSLSEAQRRIRSGHNPRPCVAITFDDGYAENCQVALPILIRERIPCTYFVTSRNVLEGVPFEHDLSMGNAFATNTLEQLRWIADAGIEIGAHTRTHPHFGRMTDPEALYDEIVGGRDDLVDALGVSIRWFAIPFGMKEHLHDGVFQTAFDAGFDGIVSAYGGYNFPGDEDFHLQRMGVDGPHVRLKNWVTLDPYKQLRIERFEYNLDRANLAGASA